MVDYIVDASAFIDAKLTYPPENFADLWDHIAELNQEGRLIIIGKVSDELKKGTDFLSSFLKPLKITDCETDTIVNEYLPQVVHQLTPGQRGGYLAWIQKADPFLVAFALEMTSAGRGIKVITHEKDIQGKVRVSTLCRQLGLQCGKFVDIITTERLLFQVNRSR